MSGGIWKSDVAFFGEVLPQGMLNEAIHRSSRCDLFILIGSTLIVYPAAYMTRYAVEAGARLVIINLSPTSMDHYAAVLIRGKAGDVMPRVIGRVKVDFHSEKDRI
jgi:NAD-dependent deacetylase